jgi:FtsH-like protein
VSPVMRDPRAICAECGHVQSFHDRAAARALPGADLTSERNCYREIGGAPCRCSGFRESGEVAIAAATQPRARRSPLTAALLSVVLVVMGLALLYAYRSQTPALTTIPLSQAVQEINAGQVAIVTITSNRATLELRSGGKQQTTLPDRDEILQRTLADYNNANPTRQIAVDYRPEDSSFTVIGSIFLSLLPVLLLGAFFTYLFRRSVSR